MARKKEPEKRNGRTPDYEKEGTPGALREALGAVEETARWTAGRSWVRGAKILKEGIGRVLGGQVVYRGGSGTDGRFTFLLRVGKRASETVHDTPAGAIQRLQKLSVKLREGERRPASRTRLDTYFYEVFIPQRKAAGELVPSTEDDYVSGYRRHISPVLGKRALKKIRRADVTELGTTLRKTLKAKTVNNILGILSSCLGHAVEHEELERNPCSRVRYSPPRRRDARRSRSATSGPGR